MSQPARHPDVSPIMEPAQPAPIHPTTASSSSHPTHPTTHQTETVPAATATTTPAPPANPTIVPASTASTLAPTADNVEPLNFFEKLTVSDPKWKWKIGMRIIIFLVSIIGIGSAGWVVSNYTSRAEYKHFRWELDDTDLIPWVLITFTLSVIWCGACALKFFLKKSHAQMAPGAQVAIDLILWLGYIVTALAAVTAALNVASWGSNGRAGTYSSRFGGPWTYHAENNTWVYDNDRGSSSSSSNYYYGSDSSSSSSGERVCNGSSSSSSSSYNSYYGREFPFADCDQLDAYVNTLWQTKGARFNAELTAAVCQWIALLLHFTLFVWACVDTHRRNSRKVSKDAEKLAAEIVQKMIKTGAVIPAPGQAHMQGYPQYYPQAAQYQQYPQYQQPAPQQVHPAFQGSNAGNQAAPQSGGRLPPHEQSTLVGGKAGRFA